MTLVAGVDSSTQSCKVVIRDAETGRLVRQGAARHPDGSEVDPEAWWHALQEALGEAGGLDHVSGLAVGAQQHGMVCLDEAAQVVRPALLWNDTRSAGAAADLVRELPGGAQAWAQAVGSVPVASFTITKLRWLAEHEPGRATRAVRVALPHDWLSWRLRGGGDQALLTDRGDASGTGYWSSTEERYRPDLLSLAFGRELEVPEVVAPGAAMGEGPGGLLLGAGTGDNAAAALGLGAGEGDLVLSVGTSGVAAAISGRPTADGSGLVAGFADATGRYLPLACTLNASRVLEAAAALLSVSLNRLSELALSAPAGADGLVLVPYLEGERTPNLPEARGALQGVRRDNLTPPNLARAAVEGLLCGLADGVDALLDQGVTVRRVLLVGGGARSAALRSLAPGVLGLPVDVPEAGEYVADGAARQAAWVLAGTPDPPPWEAAPPQRFEADPTPWSESSTPPPGTSLCARRPARARRTRPGSPLLATVILRTTSGPELTAGQRGSSPLLLAIYTANVSTRSPAAHPQPLRQRLQNPYSRLPDWVYPTSVIVFYTLFAIYGLVVSLFDTKPAHYMSYLSPFNSPEFLINIGPLHIPPGLWIAGIPFAFRLTCYYYRKAYYRSYLFHPRSCTHTEPARDTYYGETRFWIWNNLHRFAMYLTVAQVVILWYDALHAFVWIDPSGGFWDWSGPLHFGLGNVIMLVNVVCLSAYTFGCHAFRHLVGGGKDCQSCIGTRHKLWKGVTVLNLRHGYWAWISMFTVWGTDLYIRLLSHGWLIPHGIWN